MIKSIKCKAAVLHDMGLPRPFSKSKPVKIEEIEVDHTPSIEKLK